MPTIIEIRPFPWRLAVFWRAGRRAVLDWRTRKRGRDRLRDCARKIRPRRDSYSRSRWQGSNNYSA